MSLYVSLRYFTTIAAATALLCAALNAQQQANVTTRFTALSLDGNSDGIQYDSNSGSHKLRLSKAARTSPQRYSGPAELSFYTTAQGFEGGTGKHTVGTVNLSGFAGGEALLLFSENTNAPGQYRILAVDDSAANFPANSWRVLNLTPNPVALKVGQDAPKGIAPGQQQLFRFNSATRGSAGIQLAANTDGDWHVVRTSIWSHNPQMRTLILLLPTADGKGVQAQRVNQSLHALNSGR